MDKYLLQVLFLNLPSHLRLSHTSWPRPYELRVRIEGDRVKGPGAEVGANGTGDAVEKSLTTRMDTNEWLRGGRIGWYDRLEIHNTESMNSLISYYRKQDT